MPTQGRPQSPLWISILLRSLLQRKTLEFEGRQGQKIPDVPPMSQVPTESTSQIGGLQGNTLQQLWSIAQ